MKTTSLKTLREMDEAQAEKQMLAFEFFELLDSLSEEQMAA